MALWAGGRRPLGALRVVAVLTLVVLAGDVLTGSGLQLGSVFGQNPVVGGRFYGLGNTSFALYGLAVLVVVEWVAASGRSRRRRRGWRWSCSGRGLAVEALPSLGADFGGPPGLLLGGLLVVATAAGVRLTWRRVLAAVVGAGRAGGARRAWPTGSGRPTSRTHLGDFVESVVSGEAGAVVGRKLAQNLANLGSPPLLAIAVATVVLVVAARRVRWRPVPDGAVVLRGAVVMAVVVRSWPTTPGSSSRRSSRSCSRPCSWPPVLRTRSFRSAGEPKPREGEPSGIGREAVTQWAGRWPARRARRGCRARPWGG